MWESTTPVVQRVPDPMKTRTPMTVRMNAGGKMLSCKMRSTRLFSIPFVSTDGDLRIFDDQFNLLELIQDVWFVKILVADEPIERVIPVDDDGDDDVLVWKFAKAIDIEREIIMYHFPQSRSSRELKEMFTAMMASINDRDKDISRAYERFRLSYCKLWSYLAKQSDATAKVPRTASTNPRFPRRAKIHTASSTFSQGITSSPPRGRVVGSPRRQR